MARSHAVSELLLCQPELRAMADDDSGDLLVRVKAFLLRAIRRSPGPAPAAIGDRRTNWRVAATHWIEAYQYW